MKVCVARLLASLSLMLLVASATAQTGKAELLWLGQSAFRLTTPGGKVIVIDPWLRTNPRTPEDYKNLEKLGKVDLILVTHGHFDHIADALALALMHKARVFAPGDLNQTLTVLKVLPPELARAADSDWRQLHHGPGGCSLRHARMDQAQSGGAHALGHQPPGQGHFG